MLELELTDNQKLGQRFRLIRQSHGLTQHQVAQHLQISSQQIYKYENGDNRIPADVILRLSRHLAVPPEQFFPEDVETLPASSIKALDALSIQIVSMTNAQRQIAVDLLQNLSQALSR